MTARQKRMLMIAAAVCEVVAALCFGGVLDVGPAEAWMVGGFAAFFAAGA